MLTRALLSGVQRSLAAALARDPLTARRLAQLDGKVILIRAREPDWLLFIVPGSQGVQLLASSDRAPDCTLSAPSALLAQLMVSEQRQQLLQNPAVQLSGDSQVLVSLQNALTGLQLDGEAELARWIGPVAGHTLANMLRTGREWGSQAHSSLGRSLSEYLTEESRQLVGNAEARVSADQLHQLRLDLDRLEARLARLNAPDPDTADV
ncbi:ubiquinone biosynthesis accessory factor UbiJ [Halopseudomonas pelagia]|uniref:ubiquinone biosynthesis accessory factor UbiJ n=1 Tax=Halopseudomonas pelagia TaxID=553151 RepID=UPI0003A8246F|nr:SCP2 sterol-binding domain-containing protein [Halopseudomonas pelagia]|tara:strand:+ start:2567 stop:3190 length:624 start_codon:yes stop_codon:yes gene_type:complete